ncbi:MAG: hypothetical protein K2Y37_20315 [Pirellulales bacterium]|nr:hypothetical protein [Pirellulales bacterium]
MSLGFMMLAAVPLRAAGPAGGATPTGVDAPEAGNGSDAAAESTDKTYRLRYRFKAGETIRWQVEHRARVTTTVSGSTQTAETLSRSIKVWRIKELAAAPQPAVVFEHLVENVEMRQKLSGREEVVYNSATDVVPPAGFEQAAQSVGVVLARVTMDLRGIIVQRGGAVADAEGQSPLTLPLPEEAVPVGHTWYAPSETTVKLKDGQVRTVKLRQRCTLAEVRDGIAKIEVESQIITPIRDQPELEAQLIQRQSSGELQFDIAAGRLLSHRLELDKRVVGFSGEQSSLHYVTRFTEELVPAVPTVTVGPRKPAPPTAPNAGTISDTASDSGPAPGPRVAKTPDAAQPTSESPAKKPSAKSKGKPGRSNLRRR